MGMMTYVTVINEKDQSILERGLTGPTAAAVLVLIRMSFFAVRLNREPPKLRNAQWRCLISLPGRAGL